MNHGQMARVIEGGDTKTLLAHFDALYAASLRQPEGFMVHDSLQARPVDFGRTAYEDGIVIAPSVKCGGIPTFAWKSSVAMKPGDFFRKHNPQGEVVLHFVLATDRDGPTPKDLQKGYSICTPATDVRGYRGGVGLNGVNPAAVRPNPYPGMRP